MAKYGPRPKPLAERFNAKTRPKGECIEWIGNTNGVGYGMLYDRDTGKKELAHRVAIKLAEGRYPDDTVMHTCCFLKALSFRSTSQEGRSRAPNAQASAYASSR